MCVRLIKYKHFSSNSNDVQCTTMYFILFCARFCLCVSLYIIMYEIQQNILNNMKKKKLKDDPVQLKTT